MNSARQNLKLPGGTVWNHDHDHRALSGPDPGRPRAAALIYLAQSHPSQQHQRIEYPVNGTTSGHPRPSYSYYIDFGYQFYIASFIGLVKLGTEAQVTMHSYIYFFGLRGFLTISMFPQSTNLTFKSSIPSALTSSVHKESLL